MANVVIDWPNEKNIINHDTRRYSLIWTGQYTPKIHYSVRAAYFDVDRTMRVHRWVNEEGLTAGNQNRSLVWDAEGNPVWGPAAPMAQVVLDPMPFVASDEHGRRYGYAPGQLPVTEDAAARLLRLPMFYDLTADQQARVIQEVRAFFGMG